MRYILLLILSLCVCAAAADELLSKRAFTEEAARMLRVKEPHFNVKVAGELAIDYSPSGDGGGSSQLFLGNAYLQYSNHPADVTQILANYLRVADAVQQEPKCNPADVMATLKNAAYIEGVNRMVQAKAAASAKSATANQHPDLVVDPLVDDLSVAYVLDSAESTAFINGDKLAKCGMQAGELHKLALDHLRERAAGFKLNVEPDMPGLIMVAGDGYYENALMALDEYWSGQRFPFKGKIVVATPARGFLLIVDGADSKAVDGLSRMARKIYQEEPYNLTPALYVRSEGAWVRLRD